jgi:predicted transposase YdaD
LNGIFGSLPLKSTLYINGQKSTQSIENDVPKKRRVKGRKKERKGGLPKNGAEAQKLQQKQNKTLEQITEKYIQWIY